MKPDQTKTLTGISCLSDNIVDDIYHHKSKDDATDEDSCLWSDYGILKNWNGAKKPDQTR